MLLATPTDTRDAGLFKALRPRHAVHSANIFTIAQRHGCFVLNLWGMAALRDWRMWGDDRIHLTSEGHRRVALAALTALALHGQLLHTVPRKDRWLLDPRLAAELQAGPPVYAHNDLDRGHLVMRASSCWGGTEDEARQAGYSLSRS